MYILYQHTNILNSKVYIGITKYSNPNKRWLNGKGYRKDSLFYKAIIKYGWDNFTHTIIQDNLSKECAMELEKNLIAKYKNLHISYNIGNGGEGTSSFSSETIAKLKAYTGIKSSMYGKKHSIQTRNKIAQANLGKKCTAETKQKIGDANRGQNNGMYGKEVSNLFKKQVSERFSKGVIQYSLDGVFIQEFKSATEAQQFLHLKVNHIGCCCKGDRKTCGGYIWKYKENNNNESNK